MDSQGCGISGFGIFDVTDPANPVFISRGSLSDAIDVAIYENYAYLPGRNCDDGIFKALFVEDLSDIHHPSRVNVLPGYYGGVEISNGYLYLGDGAKLQVMSLLNPVTPSEVGFIIFRIIFRILLSLGSMLT